MSTEIDRDQLIDDTVKWALALGYNTCRADREFLEPRYREAYQVIQKDVPEIGDCKDVIWVNSLLAGTYVFMTHAQHGDEAALEVARYLENVTDIMSEGGIEAILKRLGHGPLKNVSLTDCLWCRSLGNMELHWVSRLSVAERLQGGFDNEDQTRRLALMRDLTRGHEWWVCPGWVIASDFPTEIHVDEQHRLHSTQGPAIAYLDGFKFYAVEGITVAEKVVERPNEITLQEIREESNAAVRRVLLMQYGLPRYLRDTNAEELDRRPGEILYHDKMFDTKWLICRDGSTNAIHSVYVPLTVNTIPEAQEQLAGVPEELLLERS